MYNEIKEEFCSIAIEESYGLIDEIKKHPFNVELMNGKLSYEKFKFFVQQTFLYLADCTRTFLIIAAKVNDIEMVDKLIFVACSIFSTRDEYKEHFANCGLSDNHRKLKSCSAFTDFLMRAAYHNSVAESLAASYLCFGIYQIIIRQMVKYGTVSNNKYQKWIDLYNDDETHNIIDTITEIVNKLYKESSNDEKKKMLEFFRNGLELGIAFCDEIYYSNISKKEC